MSDFLTNLFGLRGFAPGDSGVRFEFAVGIAPWAWTLIVPAVICAAAYGYFKLDGSRVGRAVLGTFRTMTLMLLILLACGPRFVKQDERIEKDWTVFAIDRSASLSIRDVQSGNAQVSRQNQLEGSLAAASETLNQLSVDRNVVWLGFSSGVTDLARASADTKFDSKFGLMLGEATGTRTDINLAIEQALARTAARSTAGIVLLSDGRAASPVNPALLKRLQSEHIPVFTVPLGSDKGITDVAIRRIDAPTQAFLSDIVPVSVDIEQLGAAPGAKIDGKVELVYIPTGKVLDSRDLATIPADGQLTLTSRPDSAGAAHWRVQLKLTQPDLSEQNNSALVELELSDRPIRIAYFDGTPRWEYRYLKNLLLREESIRSAAMILAPDRRFIQEGSEPIATLPTKQEDWNQFDVVILGDVRPELFSEDQQRQLRDLVAQRGSGILFIGGSNSMPQRWRNTAIGPLFPFTGSAIDGESSGGMHIWTEPVTIRREPAAERLGILQLSDSGTDWPVPIADPNSGWSLLRWVQRIDPANVKPTAEILASAAPVSAPGSASTSAAVLTMRFGAGRVAYVATDETWRWRYGRGESYQERFWLPLIRLMARESLGRSGKSALLDVSPRVAQVEQPVRISLRLLDQSLQDGAGSSVMVRVRPAQGNVKAAQDVELVREKKAEDSSAAPALYVGTYVGNAPGQFEVETATPVLDGLGLSVGFDVVASDDELRRPQADHELLAMLARETGGAVIKPGELARLSELLPNRQVRVLGPIQSQPLWDKAFPLALLVSLLVLEWIGRRLLKLV